MILLNLHIEVGTLVMSGFSGCVCLDALSQNIIRGGLKLKMSILREVTSRFRCLVPVSKVTSATLTLN